MLELADDDLILKRNPTRVLKSEIEIIRIEEEVVRHLGDELKEDE